LILEDLRANVAKPEVENRQMRDRLADIETEKQEYEGRPARRSSCFCKFDFYLFHKMTDLANGLRECIGGSISGPMASASTCTDVDTGVTNTSTCVGNGLNICVDNNSNISIGGCVSIPEASLCLQQQVN